MVNGKVHKMSQILNFKSEYKGLTSEEAEKRLSMYGCNEDSGEDSSYSLKKAMLCPRFFVWIISVILLFLAGQYVMGGDASAYRNADRRRCYMANEAV